MTILQLIDVNQINSTNGVLTVANATVNGVSFIPSWTAASLNVRFQTAAGQFPVAYWVDPFGIVHIRGSLANTLSANIVISSNFTGLNIANGFPAPTDVVDWGILGSNVTVDAMFVLRLQTNGALQCEGTTTVSTGNLTYLSFGMLTYATS